MTKNLLVVTIMVSLVLFGCQWDPPHDNPKDPLAPIAPLSQISIRVLDFARNPINDAKVILREPNLDYISSTDSLGWAHFDQLPVGGEWWALAEKNNGDILKYAVDSIQVSSALSETITGLITLDAIPYFTKVSVNSIINQLTDDEREAKIRLKAEVVDPDNIVDIKSITWAFITDHYSLNGNLQYNPHIDSTFYEAEISSSAFVYGENGEFGGIGDALTEPFYFKVTDFAQNSSQAEASLVRIFSTYPSIVDITWRDTLSFRWTFPAWDLNDGDIFHYDIRIMKTTQEVIYRDTIISHLGVINYDITGIPRPIDIYKFNVWVVDEFGNFVRSLPGEISNVNPG